ncbi:MAG: glutamate--tRNA ligase [Alphaproteobacteria bacterium]|nr:glutamate--tRNA ligase [Alphaproteobacteria bacterium]
MTDPVVTRFAPSPTGFLHIGGARTALFNWLYARRFGGKMLLRIEDTDRERSTDAAITAILDGLSWLGLKWDGEVVYQFSRAARHAEVAHDLLARGLAYYCYASAQELEEMRELARAEKRPPRYDGRWRDRDPSQTPTYMLAVVVDDHDMGVTHIIRGDDHLTNAARQTHIYQAMDWSVPSMSHIPLIHGPDGAKLSKRHGALGVDAYRALGYLPEALRNYLVRLGWSQGDKEFFSTEEMIAAFDLPQIGRSAARFDFAKLENMNGHYMRASSDQDLLDALVATLPYLPGGETIKAQLDATKLGQLHAAMTGLKERAKNLVDLLDGAAFLFAQRPLPMDDKAAEILAKGGQAHIAALIPRFEALTVWTASETEQIVRVYAEETGAKLGQVAQPLRAALTGRSTSPGIFDVLEVLGQAESLGRLRDQAKSA